MPTVTVTQRGQGLDVLTERINRGLSTAMRKSTGPVSRSVVKAFKAGAGVRSFAGYPLKFRAKKTTATATSAVIQFQASPVGFWVILESGAAPHTIKPKSAEALAFGKYRVEEVQHPGCAGKGSYTKGETAAIAVIPDDLENAILQAVTHV